MLFMPIPPDPEVTKAILPYLDPVSSGAILQTLLAIFLGVSLFIRAFWRKINAIYTQVREKFIKKAEVPSAEKTVKSTE
jgi:hypothetical protein